MTVKRAPWFIVTGAVAGFAGIIAFHVGAAAPLPRAPASTGAARTPRTPGSAPAGAGPARQVTGPDVNFSYGTIAVSVTVRGSRIVDVSVAAIHVTEPESGQISGQAIPVLRSEVLAAQSASIHAVSGATYTSRGYISSLEAALNGLRTGKGA
jgi:uncharacterized protein with FMN-binding domain